MIKALILCSLIGFSSFTLVARAEEPAEAQPDAAIQPSTKPPPPQDVSFSLGIGSLIGHNQRKGSQTWPYGARTYLRVVPIGEFRYKKLSIAGPFVSYSFLQFKDWSVHFRSGISGDQYRGIGMEERDWSFFAGASLRYKLVEFYYSRDVQSVSQGSLVGVDIGPRFPLSRRIFLISSVGATYMDRKYTEYFYGVRDNEALVERPAYHPDAAFSYSLNLRPIFLITERLSWITILRLSVFSSEVLDSPTMRKEPSFSGLVGLSYKIL